MAKSKKIKKTKKAPKRRKITKASKESKEDVFFVEVKNQGDVRVNTIDAMKLVLRLLKEYENYKQVKHQKEEAILQMRKEFREISKLAGVLKSALPTINVKFPVKKPVFTEEHKEAHKKSKGKKHKISKVAHKEATELEKLESELSAIEGKLGSLS